MTRQKTSEGHNIEKQDVNHQRVTITAEITAAKRQQLKAALSLKGLTIKEFLNICADACIEGKLDSICCKQ